MKHSPITLAYGAIAIAGGVARYLNGFVNGERFRWSIFFASVFVSGFSGWMFALVGESMNMPQAILFIMAGSGGFFGEQSLKFVFEWVTKKAK